MRACELAGVTPTKGDDEDLYNALVNIAAGSLGLRAKDILTYSTTTALTNSVLGSTVIYNGAGAAAFTLPTINTPANNCPKGTRIEILNQGTGALTITRGGADTFRYNGSGTATTIATLPPGGNIHLESDGTSNWHLAQGTLSLQYGDHLGKTAAQFDATALLATNEFVQRALGNRRGFVGLTTNTNLTAAHAGMNIYASTSTGAITLSLPAANSLPAGASFRIMNTGLDAVNVSRVGGDTIVTQTTSNAVTAITLTTGEWVEVCSLGTGSLWYHAGGSQQVARNVAMLQHVLAQNTVPPTYTSGAWRTGQLNTEVYDPEGIVSLASNQFTLQAGLYRITGLIYTQNASGAFNMRQRIYNVTDAAAAFVGINTAINNDLPSVNTAIDGFVEITAAKTFEIQIYNSGTTTSTLAAMNRSGESERYTFVNIQKLR